jgi:protein SCO1/2
MSEPTNTLRRRLTGAVVPALAAAALAGAGVFLAVGTFGTSAPTIPESCILQGADAVGGPIRLVDANGATVTEADFAGAPTVLYFGFTHCPDVCPTTMYSLAEALAAPDAGDVQPVLITLDPQRDTPAIMGDYARTEGFPAGLVGLTGTREQVVSAMSAFHVYAMPQPVPGGGPDVYNIDHSSFLYVLDGQWRTKALINTLQATPADIALCMALGLDADAG